MKLWKSMSTFWNSKWSLQTRILLLIIVISASVLTLTEWLATLSSIRAIENSVQKQTARAARRLAIDFSPLRSTDFPPEYQNEVREILELEPNVVRVDVYAQIDNSLKLVQSSSPRGDRTPEGREINACHNNQADTFMIGEGFSKKIFSTYPLQFRNGQRGIVTVISSLWPVNDILSTHFRIRLYSVLGTTILLVLAIVLVFRASVYRSVRQLVGVMRRFKLGEVSARAQENLPGEFGDLACNFNDMLGEIQGFNVHLKQQVEAATGELSRRNRELQQLNLQIYGTRKQLNQAERLALVGQLTATFAHEIGSPLSAVATHLQILLEDPQIDPRVRDRLRLANDQIDRVCGIVENLLKTTRQTAQRIPVELGEIIGKVAFLLRPTMESRQVRFEFHSSGKPCLTEGDPDLLQRLFLNLFNNSLDAISESGLVSVRISRPAHDDRNGAPRFFQIEVRDSGIGIPHDRLDHIFEPFFTTKDFGKGTGLGLAVCKDIVRQHGGRISVASATGSGTCFTILLPEIQGTVRNLEASLAAKEVEPR